MARYPAGHREQTRQQIVNTASRALRETGIDTLGIQPLMKQLGLTHGGFYSHFAGKDALVSEALTAALTRTTERLNSQAHQAPERRLQQVLDTYLSAAHRDNPGHGCALPALSAEVARQPPPVRDAYTAALGALVTQLAPHAPGHSTDEQQTRLLGLLSAMAGAVMLSRAVSDPALSDRILAAARQLIDDALAQPPSDAAGQ